MDESKGLKSNCTICEVQYHAVNWYESYCQYIEKPQCVKGKEFITNQEVKCRRKEFYGMDS